MEETEAHHKDGDTPQKNKGYSVVEFLIDLGTLAVLTATMIGAFRYAAEAHRQNTLLAQNVEQEVLNNRPVLVPNGVATVLRGQDNIPIGVDVKLRNYGKTLAVGVVIAGEMLVRGVGEPAPADSDCVEDGAIPKINIPYVKSTPAIGMGESADAGWTLAPDQPLERVNLNGVLYVVGCAYYFDLDKKTRYFSDVCVSWVPKAPQEFQNCDDPNRNYAH